VLFITDLRLSHCLAHARCGLRLGIAIEIDPEGLHLKFSWALLLNLIYSDYTTAFPWQDSGQEKFRRIRVFDL
ncbi:uncharacterized protein METZ01_LOCUS442214, partial [marine metagenome]